MPGLMDTHHHLTQSFGKALVFGEPSEIIPASVGAPRGQPGRGDRLSGHQARRAGIVAGRLHNPSATRAPAWNRTSAWWPEAAGSTGIRCVLGMICNDLRPDGSTEPHDVVMARAQAHLDRWQQHDLIHASLAVSIPEAATRSPSPPCQSSAAAAGRSSRLTSTSTSRRWNALWSDAADVRWKVCSRTRSSVHSACWRTSRS